MAGLIYVDGAISDKPGTKIDLESEIVIKEDLCPYVSRGGLKLEKAMELWGFGLDGKVCMLPNLQECRKNFWNRPIPN